MINNNMTGTLSPKLSQLPLLQQIQLDENQISGDIPTSIVSMPTLTALTLENNLITGGNVTITSALLFLWMSYNPFRGLIVFPENGSKMYSLHLAGLNLTSLPANMQSMYQIIDLDISSNRLTSLPDYIFQFQILHSLKMGDNRLKQIPSSIYNLTSLHELNISSNGLTGCALDTTPLNLTTYDISNNSYTGVPLFSVLHADQPTIVKFAGNPFGSPLPSPFSANSSLPNREFKFQIFILAGKMYTLERRRFIDDVTACTPNTTLYSKSRPLTSGGEHPKFSLKFHRKSVDISEMYRCRRSDGQLFRIEK